MIKLFKFIIFFVVFSVLLLIALDLFAINYSYPKTREEAICSAVGGLKGYNESLIYKNFKRDSKALVNYKMHRNMLHAYNKECKVFSYEDEKIIDANFNLVKSLGVYR